MKRRLMLGGTSSVIVCIVSIALFGEAGTDHERKDLSHPSRAVLLMAVDLASDAAPNESEERRRAIDELYGEMAAVETEVLLARTLVNTAADAGFTAIIAAADASSIGYLSAARESYARYRGALDARDPEWTAKQMTAARKYAALAAEQLLLQATRSEERAGQLREHRFAIRRAPEDARAFLAALKRSGLNAEQRDVLRGSGLDAQDVATYQQLLLTNASDTVGVSVAELYARVTRVRRAWAGRLQDFARRSVTQPGAQSASFLVGNPGDRDAVVNLFIKRAAVSPLWTISLSEVRPASEEGSAGRLKEVERGRHYQVRLPAAGQIRLVSVATPHGPVGENTTARWAIEGRIGEELLGGIVQEAHVPAFLPNLQLPGVGLRQAPAAVQPPATAAGRWKVFIIAGTSMLLIIAIAVVVLRARKRA